METGVGEPKPEGRKSCIDYFDNHDHKRKTTLFVVEIEHFSTFETGATGDHLPATLGYPDTLQ